MKLSNVSLGLVSLLGSFGVYAGTMGPVSGSDYFVAISGGPSWTSTGDYQVITLQPAVVKAYVPDNLSNSNLMGNGELFVGKQLSFYPQIQSQFGLDLYISSYAQLNGFVQEDADPNFQNFTYQYRIGHGHIAFKSKWIFENMYNLNPYLSGSIGLGFNRSYDYAESSMIHQEIPAPAFRAHTQAAFTYSVGAGFQYSINQQLAASVGYQLVSWGSSNLDSAVGQFIGKGLSLSNLYTQGLEFTVSYFL